MIHWESTILIFWLSRMMRGPWCTNFSWNNQFVGIKFKKLTGGNSSIAFFGGGGAGCCGMSCWVGSEGGTFDSCSDAFELLGSDVWKRNLKVNLKMTNLFFWTLLSSRLFLRRLLWFLAFWFLFQHFDFLLHNRLLRLRSFRFDNNFCERWRYWFLSVCSRCRGWTLVCLPTATLGQE